MLKLLAHTLRYPIGVNLKATSLTGLRLEEHLAAPARPGRRHFRFKSDQASLSGLERADRAHDRAAQHETALQAGLH
jgi:hypothetical protein